MSEFLVALDAVVAQEWERIRAGQYWRRVMSEGYTPDLYQRTLVEIFYYTSHNSKNQAVAAILADPEETELLAYCYKHAREELGHEKLVVHDLRSMDLYDPELLARAPLPATMALIGYLYFVAAHLGPVPRLGYSFWAESAYDHIGPVLNVARCSLGLTDKQMTFFVAHQGIDAEHAVEVRRMLERYAVSDELRQQVIHVARTTLYLTGRLLEDVFVDLGVRDVVPSR